MHFSRYSLIFPHGQDPERCILFCTKTAAIIETSRSTLKNLATLKKDREILRKYGFLVADREEEERELLSYVADLDKLNRCLSIKVVLSLDCNLSCRYCFEGTRKGKYYMSKETASDLLAFVEQRVMSEAIDEIHLVFYGGEPLLSKALIIYIAERVKAFAEERSVPFSFSLMTNGTLLTPKTAEMLKPLGLTEAYITIDGLQDSHDRSRPYKSGRGSFSRILKNIKETSGIVDIHINSNYSRDTFRTLPKFLAFLHDNGLGTSVIAGFRTNPILAESGEYALPEFTDGCASYNEPWLFEAAVVTREEILKHGFHSDKISPGVCAMEHQNNMMVNYNGDIYKCPGLIGRREFCIGSLRAGISDYRASHNLDNWKTAECLRCAYLPLCFGGCRYMQLVRDGFMKGVDCKKPFFDATLESMVKQDMKYNLS